MTRSSIMPRCSPQRRWHQRQRFPPTRSTVISGRNRKIRCSLRLHRRPGYGGLVPSNERILTARGRQTLFSASVAGSHWSCHLDQSRPQQPAASSNAPPTPPAEGFGGNDLVCLEVDDRRVDQILAAPLRNSPIPVSAPFISLHSMISGLPAPNISSSTSA